MGVAGKIAGFAFGALTLGVLGYVVKEVQVEYDSTVEENNRLRKFIDDHDFYERLPEKPAASKKSRWTKHNGNLKKVDGFVNAEGREVNVYQDKTSGFKVYEFGKIKKDA